MTPVSRLFPQRLPREAGSVERLRYVRHWAIVCALIAIPVWVLVFVWVHSSAAVVLFAAVTALTVVNIASLTWRIDRAERQ